MIYSIQAIFYNAWQRAQPLAEFTKCAQAFLCNKYGMQHILKDCNNGPTASVYTESKSVSILINDPGLGIISSLNTDLSTLNSLSLRSFMKMFSRAQLFKTLLA